LKIDCYFSEGEVNLLRGELPATIDRESERMVFEQNGAIRSIFAPHFVNRTYKKLTCLEKVILPCRQILGTDIYLHQYKVNIKQGLKAEWWEWHQDFAFWHNDDHICQPNLVSVLIYLQDTDSTNGALLLIPESHNFEIAEFANKSHVQGDDRMSSLNADLKFTIHQDVLRKFVNNFGITTVSGKRGTIVFFHCNIFHASNSNLTPFDREAIILTYNDIANIPRNVSNPRPEYIVGRNYIPIRELSNSLFD
jgi:ectoine hydroxylase